MRLSPEAEAQLAQNRLKKLKNDADNKKCFWAFVALGCIIFGTSFFAGARSTMLDGAHGSGIFYTAMAAGFFQILLGIGMVIIGFVNYRRSPVAGTCCIGICLILLIYYCLHTQSSISYINIILLLAALALCTWSQIITHREEALKTEEGYPLFSPEASYAGEYELPADVRLRKQAASRAMGTVGPPAAPPLPAAPEQETAAAAASLFGGKDVRLPQEVRLPEVKPSDFGLEAELGTARAAIPAPQITGDVSLAGFVPQEADVPKTGADALPKVSAEELLMDMTAVPSHAVQKGDASQLPDPAEVRARMAAMKQARDEHEAAMKQARLDHPLN